MINITNGAFFDNETGCKSKKVATKYKIASAIVAGAQSAGREALLTHIIADSLNSPRATFVIQNGNALPKNEIRDYFTQHNYDQFVITIDFCRKVFNNKLNIFRGVQIDIVIDMLIGIMSDSIGMNDELKRFSERYFEEIFNILRKNGEKFSLSNLSQYADKMWFINEGTALLNNKKITQSEYDLIYDFADNYLSLNVGRYYDFQHFCKIFGKSELAAVLSGTTTFNMLIEKDRIFNLILDNYGSQKQSNIMLNLLLKRALLEMRTNPSLEITFIFEDINLIESQEFKDLLIACSSDIKCTIYFTDNDIAAWNQQAFSPENFCNTFFIFKQNSPANRKAWSEISGTFKREEKTVHTSSYNQVYGRENTGVLGAIANIVNRNKEVCTGMDTHLADAFNLEDEDMLSLDNNTSIVMIKECNPPYIQKVSWR